MHSIIYFQAPPQKKLKNQTQKKELSNKILGAIF